MGLTRRGFVMAVVASAVVPARAGDAAVSVVLAPSNLGLSPVGSQQQGTWRAPQALMQAGLAQALDADEVISLERPAYQFDAQPGTRIRNGVSIRAFSLNMAEKVTDILRRGRFPVVIGGDCSILLGGLYGSRSAGGRGLVHVDGHSDFYHPANYDTTRRLGAVAGMDLALASGRGENLLTAWPQIGKPLADDADIVQIGQRDGRLSGTGITQWTVQRALADGIDVTARAVLARLQARSLDKVWLHVDLDVLDDAVMPAVDSPGSPGFDYAQLSALIGALCASGRIAGANFAIYDPERDPNVRYAEPLVRCIAEGVRARAQCAHANTHPCDSSHGVRDGAGRRT
jgi:arginase